ncbi:hypothetical protein EE612_039402, partial [Oryza sativa]
ADLAFVAGEHLRGAEAAHGVGELVPDQLRARAGELPDELPRPRVRQQLLVRLQEAHGAQQVLVVAVVELRRRVGVEVDVPAVAGGGALAAEEVAVPRAHAGVGPPRAGVVPQPRLHGGARGAADGVRAGEHGEVQHGEPPRLEEGDEVGDALPPHGHVLVGVHHARPPPVLPPVHQRPVLSLPRCWRRGRRRRGCRRRRRSWGTWPLARP